MADLSSFRHFLRVLAARSGQLLSFSDVSRDLGIAVNTVKDWVSVLETTFQVIVLRPRCVATWATEYARDTSSTRGTSGCPWAEAIWRFRLPNCSLSPTAEKPY